VPLLVEVKVLKALRMPSRVANRAAAVIERSRACSRSGRLPPARTQSSPSWGLWVDDEKHPVAVEVLRGVTVSRLANR
jgi:hypothetical protein